MKKKEREDVTAVYKSSAQQHQQSEENDDASVVPTTQDELSLHEPQPQSAPQFLVQPASTERELFRGRSSPGVTTGLQKLPASVGSVGAGRASVVVDDDGDYQHLRSTDGGTATIQQSVDSTGVYQSPASNSKNLLPHYFAQRQHSYPSADELEMPATGTSSQSSSESVNDGVNLHNQMDFRAAAFAHARISDETARNYGNISGELVVDAGDMVHESKVFKSSRRSGSASGRRYHTGRLSRTHHPGVADRGLAGRASGTGEGHHGVRSVIRCPICNKLFNNSSALAKHKLTHSDERKYTCNKCSKAFKRQDHLNGHMMTHSSKKPFECKFIGCAKSYCDARSLRRHLENHHQDFMSATAAAAFDATAAASMFDSSNSLDSSAAVSDRSLHASAAADIHAFNPNSVWTTGYNPLDEPKPVKCHVCDRGFKNIAALNGHMRLHGGYVRKDPGEFVMTEDGSHQYSGSDIIATEAEPRAPSLLASEAANEIAGKFVVENCTKAAASSELMHAIGSRMQSRLFEMHGDSMRRSPYGLWMSAEGAAMRNGDRRNEGASTHESLVYWSSLLPVSSVAPATNRNVAFEHSQKLPKCSTEAATVTHNSNVERMAASDSDLAMKLKDNMDIRAGREREQFNLWKIASLIRGISPSDKGRRNESDVRGETFPHGSLMEDGKIAERLWTTFGQNDHHVKPKSLSASSTLSYPVYGSETGTVIGSDSSSQAQLLSGNRTGGQLSDNLSLARNEAERFANDQSVAFAPNLKTVEEDKKCRDVMPRIKLSPGLQDSSQLSESSRNEQETETEGTETREISTLRGAVKGIMSVVDDSSAVDNRQGVAVGSFLDDNVTSRNVATSQLASLPTESASSSLTGHDNVSASSESGSNIGISLYRRRVKNLLLKRGNSLTEGFEAEMPRSPRIQNHFGTAAFEHGNDSLVAVAADNVCGNFHKEETCCQEYKDEMQNNGTVCSSLTESSYRMEQVAASTGCDSGEPTEQEKILKHDKVSGTSYGVVNYAVASSGITISEDYRKHISTIDCGYAGHHMGQGDGMRYGCVEKVVAAALQMPGNLCCHDACGHSICEQHCATNIGTHRLSPAACHLPVVKQSPTAVCDVTARCCSVAHRLGALPTPTRACAAALCQLSCSGTTHGSPKHSDTSSSGCQFSRPRSAGLCNTPGHLSTGTAKCSCILRDASSCLHQSGCSYMMAKSLSSVRGGCLARSFGGHLQDQAGEVAPCMAHTPYTPRESTCSPRELDTPQDQAAGGLCEPCTPHSMCSSHRTTARKHATAHTPSAAACYFQFPPAALHMAGGPLDCQSVCQQSPCLSCTRRLQCHTPCMSSPLNLTIGHHPCTPQCCCFQHQLLTSAAAARHRPTCGCGTEHKNAEIQQTKSGGVADGHRESEVSTNRKSLERATVAEPDSTMSNESAGDQMMPTDADSHSMAVDHYAAEERSTTDMVGHHLQHDAAAAGDGGRNFRDRFQHWGFDAARSGRRSEAVTSELSVHSQAYDAAEYVEPSSSETNEKRALESVLGGWTSRKRQMYTDAEVEPHSRQMSQSSAVAGDRQPADSARKKHRPDPLVLPPSLSSFTEHYGYPSWLRSPRAWSSKGPIPYTPPPMLSPARRAPGLFWAAARAQDQPSLPWSMFRQPSAFTYPEMSEEMPPPTDTQPHINIGAQFQATLPPLRGNAKHAMKDDDRADLLWHPEHASNASSQAGVYGIRPGAVALQEMSAGRQFPLPLFNFWPNDPRKMLMSSLPPVTGVSTALQLHDYRADAEWSSAEIERFQQAVVEFDKDFMKISQHVGTKRAAQCVQYYYQWKKEKSEDYRRLSMARRRRHEDELYQLRAVSAAMSQHWQHKMSSD